jgi:ActR/RegA family two-component response regulator
MYEIKLLIIDDDKEFRVTLAERLEMRGAIVQNHSSSMDVIKKIEKVAPSIIILTLPPQQTSELDLLLRIKSKFPDPGIICLTSLSFHSDKCRRLGIRHCLSKPVSMDALLEALQDAIPFVKKSN